MILGPALQWLAFLLFALLTVLGALGMTTTMSMFRSGIFLMASFIGVAGLFILLSADLLGLLQIMMYIGGMLVMILFMLLFSMDPGGAMMASMRMAPLERLFSRGLLPQDAGDEASTTPPDPHAGHDMAGMPHGHAAAGHAHHAPPPGSPAAAPPGPPAGHQHHPPHARADAAPGDTATEAAHGGHTPHHSMVEHGQMEPSGMNHGQMEHGGMDMGGMDMSMVTPARPWAAGLGLAVTVVLVGLLLWRPAWPHSGGVPDPDAARQVGTLLMGRYMMAFEGAGLLILLGIFGAVMLQRPGSHPSDQGRGAYVTAEKNPVPISGDEP